MTAGPWLTIITVVKDDPDGLERTLLSLQGADLTGVEHIIIDSSQDPSSVPAIVTGFNTAARVAWSPPEGVYPAMNAGLDAATGTYVLYLNAGDELAAASALSDVGRAVTSGDVEWLFGRAEIIGTDGTSVVTPEWDYRAEQRHSFSRGRFPAHQATVVRTESLREVGGFDTSYRIAADYAVALAMSLRSAPRQLSTVVARFHEGGLSTVQWARSIREFHQARRRALSPSGADARRESWATARQFVSMSLYRSPWPLVALLAILSVTVMGLTGVGWISATLLTGMVLIQGIAGALWWRLMRPSRSVPILEAVGMGLGLGTAGSMLMGLWLWWWLLPAGLFVVWLVVRRHRPVAPLAPFARPDALAVLVGLIPGVAALLQGIRSYPLSWIGEFGGYHGDMPFFEALAASVARLGPSSSIFMEGASLKYHSLVYGWAGQLTVTVDAEPFVVLTRLLPLACLVAVIALAAGWTRQLTSIWWAPSLAVALVVTGGFVGATYGSVLNMDSPSQSLGVVWFLALSIALLQALGRVSLSWHLIAIVVLVVALTGGKISTAAVAAAGFGLVVVVALIRREPWAKRGLVVGVVAALAMGITYQLLLAGSANAGGLRLLTLLDRASSVQGLNPVITPRGIVAGIVLLVMAVLPRWMGLVWLMGDRASRWSASTIYGVGVALGGLGTLAVLSGGFNDLWFAVAASAPLAVLSAVGVAKAASWLGPSAQRRVITAAALGLLGSILVALIWATGSTGVLGDGWRWAGPVVGGALALVIGLALTVGVKRPVMRAVVALTIIAIVFMAVPARIVYAVAEPFARPHQGSMSPLLFTLGEIYVPTRDQDRELTWTDSQAEAARWLRENSDPDHVIATNLTLGALVPSLTRMTTYISDIHIQAPYSQRDVLPDIERRERESWDFINDPSAATVDPLCRAGVDWVWVDLSRTPQSAWGPFASPVWEGPDTTILRVNRAECPA